MSKKIPEIQSDSGGVVVEITSSKWWSYSIGYIKNTNEFPVRVKKVTIRPHDGECTDWLKVFQPGEEVDLRIDLGSKFYVYNMNGVLIGFIIPRE